ncbi:MAG: S-layer homology domain-containing protein, partial [Firmicutes bacterium]|nr:S-layer homology domain-containing protein [Bacillota bacterium]
YWPVTFQASTATFRTDGLGTMRETVFTAGDTAGSGTLTARFGSASGTAKITVVDKVDSIVIRSEDAGTELAQLTIKAGASIDLTAAAVRNGLEVLSADASYEWAVTGGIGTVDADGVFTAFDAVGEGTVSCEAGGVSAAVDVKVVPEGVLLADFEAGEATYNGRAGTGIESKILANDREYVRYGQKSLELDYDFGLTRDGETAFYPLNLRLGDNATELRLWVYGDGSGNAVSAEFGAFTGLVTVDAGTLDFTGWKQLVIAVPVSARTLTNLNLTKTEGGAETGKIYLDQILSSRGEYADLTAPQVTLSVEGRTLTGLVTDDMDGEIPRERVTVTFDGKPLNVNYSLTGQSFTATLPAADAYDHMIAATAEDLSGNRSRVFLTLAAEKKNETDEEGGSGDVYAAEIPFIDTAGHWSESYANYLYQQGLSEGSETADGIVYRPEDYMNRQEIAVMLARWLGVNGAYDGVVLPYNDTDEIADWALPAAKAMYALGIIQGSDNPDGTVSFLPAALLSREAIMTMIGRIQDKGYAESDMDFVDADKVSDWALPYVRSLVGQKVITGDAGWLRPLDPVKRGEAAKIICCLY